MVTADSTVRLRALIVDDEPHGRLRIRDLLQRENNVEIVGECEDGESAITSILRLSPDVVFLDIQMPGATGLEVADAVGDAMPMVVFITAYDEFAIPAFEAAAVDYLMKPVSAVRFQVALDRVRSQLSMKKNASQLPQVEQLLSTLQRTAVHPIRMPVKVRGQYIMVSVDEIEWIEAAENYVVLHVGERTYMRRDTMSRVLQRLDPRRFLRIARSVIVNIEHIQAIEPWSGTEYNVILKSGASHRSSRLFKDQIRSFLKGTD